jgi:hypothetical protein
MMTVATPKLATRLAGITGSRRLASRKSATEYLARLLTTNSARVANDFSERVLESRRRIQSELQEHLRTIVSSAERALSRANERRALDERAVERELETYDRLRTDLVVWTAQPPGG